MQSFHRMPETVQAEQLGLVDHGVLPRLERMAKAGELPIYGLSLDWSPLCHTYDIAFTVTMATGHKLTLRISDWIVIDRHDDLSVYTAEAFYNKFRRA